MASESIHQGQPIAVAGRPLEEATAATVVLHGRGATASDILTRALLMVEDGQTSANMARLFHTSAHRVHVRQDR
jgi:hypothetical protein